MRCKNKKNISLFFLVLLCFFANICPAMAQTVPPAVDYTYIPMEEIPGFGRPTDFPGYLMAVYKFGLWTVGLAAMLMIIIGGYTYLTSAGNNATMGTAKKIITDAIAGLILALVSWVLLYAINPELVEFRNVQIQPTTFTNQNQLLPN